MPLSYSELRDIHDSLGLEDSLPEWSAKMNQLTGTSAYGAGLNDSWLRRRSGDLDKLLEYTGLPWLGEKIGGAVGGEAGAQIGHGLARTALDFLPMTLATGGAGTAASALLSGIRGYADTGNVSSGVIGAATTAAMPWAAGLAGQGTLKALGAPLIEGAAKVGEDATGNALLQGISTRLPQNIGQGLSSFAAQTLAGGVVGEVSDAVDAAFDPNRDYEFNPAKSFLGMTLGQLPFAGHLLGKEGLKQFGGKATREHEAALQSLLAEGQKIVEKKQATINSDRRQPIEEIPQVIPPSEVNLTAQAEAAANVQKILARTQANNRTPTEAGVAENAELNTQLENIWAEHGDLLNEKPFELPPVQINIPAEDHRVLTEKFSAKVAQAETGLQVLRDSNAAPELQQKAADRLAAVRAEMQKSVGSDDPETAYEGATNAVTSGNLEWSPGVGLRPRDLFGSAMRKVNEAQASIQTAKTTAEFHVGLSQLNDARKDADLPLLAQKHVEALAKKLKISLTDAASAIVNKTKRKVEGKAKATEEEQRRIAEQRNVLSVKSMLGEASTESGENTGTRNNVPIVKTPKLSNETEPLHDYIGDSIVAPATVAAKPDFEAWQKKTDEPTTFGEEVERYQIYSRLRNEKAIGAGTKLSNEDAAELKSEFVQYGLENESGLDLADFPSRPHILALDRDVQQRLAAEQQKNINPSPIRPSPNLPAGTPFVYGFENYDEATNKIGKHTLPKTGVLKVSQFKNMGGRGKPLADAEIELGKTVVPEAFDAEGNVDVRKLYKGLKENGPVVEIKKLQESIKSPTSQEWEQLQHEYDTSGKGFPSFVFDGSKVTPPEPSSITYYNAGRERRVENPAPEELAKALRYQELGQARASEPLPSNDSRYSFLGPKPESAMPGYVEGLVRVPRVPEGDPRYKQLKSQLDKGEGLKYPEESEEWQNLHKAKYSGPHFGSEDTNVLAFFRGYEETMPDGSKAFHVIEVQSDWGQARREAEKKLGQKELKQDGDQWYVWDNSRNREVPGSRGTEKWANGFIEGNEEAAQQRADKHVAPHPLLGVYEPLALKAAIAHAKSIGATKIILSDAETAMMTEGHDKQQFRAPEGYIEGTPFTEQQQIPQSAGMRLHYDITLPSAMAKLTGDKGERVEVGVHKGALDYNEANPNHFDAQGNPIPSDLKGSPIFKDAQGNPKTAISGRIYDLSKISDISDQQGGLTLTDPSRAPKVPLPSKYTPVTPEASERLAQVNLAEGGRGLANYVATDSSNPQVSARAKLLLDQYPELLKRTQVVFKDPFAGSHAHMDPYIREGVISLDGALLYGDPSILHQVAMHELEHQMSLAELYNPTKAGIKDNLEALRQRMVDALPKEEKEALDNATASGWLSRWSKAQAPFEELHPDTTTGQKLYGLLNVKEFVAEGGAANSPLRKYLQSQKGKGQGWFTKFKGYIKQLLGYGTDVQGTALGEFLEHTNALYDRGEHIASFYNFGERYFEGRGDNRMLAQSRTLQAAGILQDANAYSVSPRDIFDTLGRGGSSMSAAEKRTEMNLQRSIQNKDEDFGHLLFSAKDVGIEPSQRGLDQFLQEALNGTSMTRSVLTTMPEVAARYMFEKAKGMKAVLEGLGAASDSKNEGYLNIANPKSVRKPVADSLKAINKVLAYEKEFDMGADIINDLSATVPNGFLEKTLAAAPKWSDENPAPTPLLNFIDPADPQPKQKGKMKRMGEWFKRNFGLMNQYSDQLSQELFTKMRQLGANIHKFATNSLKAWSGDLQSGDDSLDARKGIMQVLKNVPVRKGADAYIFENQIANRDAVSVLDEKSPQVQKILADKTPQQRQDIIDSVKRHQLATIIAHGNILGAMEDIAVLNGTRMLNASNGQKQQHNNVISRTMWDILNVKQQDPVAVAKMQSDLTALRSRMTDEDFNSLYKYLDAEHGKYVANKEYFDANPAWSSAKHIGEYMLTYKAADGTTKNAGVDSRKEANELLAEKGGKELKFESQSKPGDEEIPHLGTDWQGISDKLKAYHDSAIDILKSAKGWSAEDIATYEKLSPARMFSRDVQASGIPDVNAPTRQLNRGAEDIPYIENHIHWVNQQARFWNRQKLRAEFDSYLAQDELTPDMKKQVRTMKDNFLRPDPESIKKINSFVRTWYLGAQLAVPMMNLTQFMQTHVGELTAMTGSVRQGYSRIMSTLGQLVKRYVGGEKTWSDPEYAKLEKDAKVMGELGGSKFDDDDALREATARNLASAANYGRPKTMWQQATSLIGTLGQKMMLPFQATETFNNHLGILTAFKLFREQGQSYQEARDNAFTYNARVNFTGAKAARPLGSGFQSSSPTIRGAAMLATAMKSYMLGSLGQTVRFINRGFFDNSSLTPAQRFAAKKAAIQVLGTQVAAAGLVGLPFVSAMLGLIEKMTGWEANKKLRETVHKLFNEDDESGGLLSDMTMTGLPSMLGWDMQSRLSAGNSLPGVSELNGFQPENLLGPSVNLASDFIRGTGKALTGQNPTNLVPPALRKLEQLVVNDGQIRDYRDRPVLNDLTPGEKTGIALGFNPKRLSDFNAASRMADLSEHNQRRETSMENQQLAEEAMRGNFGSVRQTLLAKAAQNKDFDAAGTVEDIARVAEELTFPRDLRREGYDPSKSKVLSYFNLSQAGPTEETRLAFRQKLASSLGLPTPPSNHELLLAKTIDALRLKSPGASRSELRQTAERLLRQTSREQTLVQ